MKARLIRGGSGLGDSLYVRPVAEHFVRAGEAVTVLSWYPDVFIGSGAQVAFFEKKTVVDTIAHYSPGKRNPATTQWQDVLRCAGIAQALPLSFEWRVKNRALIEGLRKQALGRPIVLVHGGREPMGRGDNFGIELLPGQGAFEAALGAFEDCLTVRIGRGRTIYRLAAGVDLNGGTTVADVLDLAWSCDALVAQCSFAVPLAEAFDKPLLAVWAAQGLVSQQRYISTITPAKLLQGARSEHVMDDAPADAIRAAAEQFRERHAIR